MRLPVATAQAARMFWMNLQTWKTDPFVVAQFGAEQLAVIEAWRKRQPARLSVGNGELAGMTFNRTRENGPVDTRVSVLRADSADGRPFAASLAW